MIPFDLQRLEVSFSSKIDKDEKRIRLFVAATQKKAYELALDPGQTPVLIGFVKESGALIAKWALRAKKLSFADLFRDPYKDLREETRLFAREWELDKTFRDSLG